MKARPLCQCLSVAALSLALPLDAWGAEPSAISWSRLPGAEACPALDEVAARVEQHLKRRAFVAPADASLLIEASISPHPSGGFLVSIGLSRPGKDRIGTRDLKFELADCSAAVDAAALALALMIDPDFEARTAGASPSAPSPTAALPQPVPAAEPARPQPPPFAVPVPAAPCPAPAERLAVRLSAGPWLGLGVLPEPGFGVTGGVSVGPGRRHYAAELVGGYLAPRRQLARSNAGADFWATFLGLNASWAAVRSHQVRLSLGAGVYGGVIQAEAFGFASSYYGGAWQLDVGAHLELEVGLSEHWQLLLRPNLLVPTRRETFEVTGADQTGRLFTSAPVQLAFSACVAFAP